MTDLLKIEWLKIKNYRTFILMSIFFVIGILAVNYIVYTVFDNMVTNTDAGVLLNTFNPYEFKYVWETISYTSGYLLLLPAMLLIILTTNEFTFRTNRQNIIDGWTRQQFLVVKVLMALLFAICSTFVVILVGFVFGFSTKSEMSFAGFLHVGFFFLKALSYNMFALMISTLVRKTGFAIGVFFIYMGAENIISQILDGLSMYINKLHKIDLGSMGDYLPMNASDGLLTFPENPFKSMTKGAMPTEYEWVVFSFAILYLFLFYFISNRKMLKSDL
jgi:hypothetical protein